MLGETTMEYRLADEKDTDRLAELRWEHKNSETPFDITEKEGFVQFCSDYLKSMLQENFYCWIAEENGVIISHIYIIIVKKVPKPDKMNGIWGHVTAVYTVAEYRNKGIGSALMNKVKEWSLEQGLEHLIVWPSDRAVPFYERAGFCGINDVFELSLE